RDRKGTLRAADELDGEQAVREQAVIGVGRAAGDHAPGVLLGAEDPQVVVSPAVDPARRSGRQALADAANLLHPPRREPVMRGDDLFREVSDERGFHALPLPFVARPHLGPFRRGPRWILCYSPLGGAGGCFNIRSSRRASTVSSMEKTSGQGSRG